MEAQLMQNNMALVFSSCWWMLPRSLDAASRAELLRLTNIPHKTGPLRHTTLNTLCGPNNNFYAAVCACALWLRDVLDDIRRVRECAAPYLDAPLLPPLASLDTIAATQTHPNPVLHMYDSATHYTLLFIDFTIGLTIGKEDYIELKPDQNCDLEAAKQYIAAREPVVVESILYIQTVIESLYSALTTSVSVDDFMLLQFIPSEHESLFALYVSELVQHQKPIPFLKTISCVDKPLADVKLTAWMDYIPYPICLIICTGR